MEEAEKKRELLRREFAPGPPGHLERHGDTKRVGLGSEHQRRGRRFGLYLGGVIRGDLPRCRLDLLEAYLRGPSHNTHLTGFASPEHGRADRGRAKLSVCADRRTPPFLRAVSLMTMTSLLIICKGERFEERRRRWHEGF